jgi:signal transduction histidine kinase
MKWWSLGRLGLRARIVAGSAILAIAIGSVGVVVTLEQTSRRLRDAAASAPEAPAVGQPRQGPMVQQPNLPGPEGPRLGTPAERKAEGRVVDRVIATSRRRGLLTVTGLAALSVVAAWVLSGRLVRPIRRMTDTARLVTTAGSGKRIGLVGPHDEVHELADTIDEMLDRLDRSFETQRRFVSDASHELRTPLSILRAEADVSLDDGSMSPEALRASMQRIGTELDRMSSLVESLLHLSRAETLISVAPLDLATACEEALANAARLRVGPRTVRTNLGPAPVVGDPLLIDRLVGNLVENAFRHTPIDGLICVRTSTELGSSKLSVENDGQVFADDEVGELSARFRRGGPSRSRGDGHGLGLAIVRAIAETHGASLTMHPRPTGGLSVTVAFAAPTAG